MPVTGVSFRLIVLATIALLAGPAHAGEPVFQVIVHSSNPAQSVSSEQLSRLMLRKTLSWPHGVAVEPVDLGGESPLREAFSRAVHGRSVSSIKNYWQRQAASGGVAPPPELGSDADVARFVASRPGGIGYVSAAFFHPDMAGVKVVAVQEGSGIPGDEGI